MDKHASPPGPRAGLAQAPIPAGPGPPSRLGPPSPLQASLVLRLQLNFPSVQFLFLEHTGCFPCVRERGKNLAQKEKTHLLR